MAIENEKLSPKVTPAQKPKPPASEPEKPQPMQRVEAKPAPEAKLKFLVWFTGALNRFTGVQAHHMTSIRAYFQNLGLGEPETLQAYDEGLIKYGFRRKN